MSNIPKLRCPCCGMLVYLRNMTRRHAIDSYVNTIGGKTKDGKPVCRYQKIVTEGLVSYWIKRLQIVLHQLEAIEAGTRQFIVLPLAMSNVSVSQVYGTNQAKLIVKIKPTSLVVSTKANRLVLKQEVD